ncbi:MAG: hypothetical protein AVDCRST_MAG39-230, partial [uncultured Sphingomonadaceae bacterium]
ERSGHRRPALGAGGGGDHRRSRSGLAALAAGRRRPLPRRGGAGAVPRGRHEPGAGARRHGAGAAEFRRGAPWRIPERLRRPRDVRRPARAEQVHPRRRGDAGPVDAVSGRGTAGRAGRRLRGAAARDGAADLGARHGAPRRGRAAGGGVQRDVEEGSPRRAL